MTDRHQLATPPEGQTNWDNPLNDNFRAIDTKLPVVDLSANLGQYQPKEDALFVAVDTGAIYRGDGNNWNELPSAAVSYALGDDQPITFGADTDYSIEYDSVNNYLQVRDEGAAVDIIRLLNSTDVSLPNGGLIVGGGDIDQSGSNGTFIHDRQDVSTSITTDGSGYYSVDSSGGTVTLTLATADAIDGTEVNVKRNGANNVTVATEGTQTIDGASSITLTSDDESVTLVYNGTNTDWEVY